MRMSRLFSAACEHKLADHVLERIDTRASGIYNQDSAVRGGCIRYVFPILSFEPHCLQVTLLPIRGYWGLFSGLWFPEQGSHYAPCDAERNRRLM